MSAFHGMFGLSTDDAVGVIAVLMVLTLLIGNIFTRRFHALRAAWPTLLWMALVWAGIIATAALAFRHFRPGVL